MTLRLHIVLKNTFIKSHTIWMTWNYLASWKLEMSRKDVYNISVKCRMWKNVVQKYNNIIYMYKTKKKKKGALIVYSYMLAYAHRPKKLKIRQKHSMYCINLFFFFNVLCTRQILLLLFVCFHLYRYIYYHASNIKCLGWLFIHMSMLMHVVKRKMKIWSKAF